LAIADATKAIMAGSDTGAGVILVASVSTPHPTKTITITNGSTEPLDWTAIQINSVPDVTVTGGTCPSAGDLAHGTRLPLVRPSRLARSPSRTVAQPAPAVRLKPAPGSS